MGSLCCACGDTLASELGTALDKDSDHKVFHLIKLREVPRGTNGGISWPGTLASVIGGFLVSLSYLAILKLSLYTQNQNLNFSAWILLIIGALSGFIGSLIDSILGGMLQYSGLDKKSGKITNFKSSINKNEIIHISGHDLLSNNQVNFISCLSMSILTPFLSLKLLENVS